MGFSSLDGSPVPSVTAAEMKKIDDIAVEDFGIEILQMMENAGRNLGLSAASMLPSPRSKILVLAGNGGNGGGGLCAARHLTNHGFDVSILIDRKTDLLNGPALRQLNTLSAAKVQVSAEGQAGELFAACDIVVDALIGYSLRGAPRGSAADLIRMANESGKPILSLDVPSGVDATAGAAPGVSIAPTRTLTLALPKTGLESVQGEIFLADIGIPNDVYRRAGITGLTAIPLFMDDYVIELEHTPPLAGSTTR